MGAIRRPRWFIAAFGLIGISLLAALLTVFAPHPEARAMGPWKGHRHHQTCGHPGCAPGHCLGPAGWAGSWSWMRSPDQERRVVMGLFNRYCIRCHGIDGRGVWDIPDVPDFTDPRWQASRPDPQIVNILMEGRGAVMPSFRGTLTIEEAWGMAGYLRTFVPGTEVPRPDVGRSEQPRRNESDATPTPPLVPDRPSSR